MMTMDDGMLDALVDRAVLELAGLPREEQFARLDHGLEALARAIAERYDASQDDVDRLCEKLAARVMQRLNQAEAFGTGATVN